jgi:iron complex outermembrane receptor protein
LFYTLWIRTGGLVRASVRLLLLLLLGEVASSGQDIAQSDIKKLSLEELMDLNVTSVTRRAESLAQTAAAVTVITSEDIRRAGVTNLPEALRLVPGLQVARFNAGSWAISARGFNSTAANKLLVLIDGRTVYSPIFSGTFWEIQDLILDDVLRIEVVRGPGATLWGANAVNGIINIITKTAHQTRDTALRLTGGGADDLLISSLRVGAGIGPETSYRVFGKYFYRDQMALANHDDAKDSVRFGRAGFRLDSSHGRDEVTIQGDAFRGFAGLRARDDAKDLGGNILGRWNRKLSATSEIQVQTYYDRLLRRVPLQSEFHQKTFDIDFQHQFKAGPQTITWGAGYRWNRDETIPTAVLSFVPQNRSYPIVSAFVQDEIAFAQNRMKLALGSKFEHNDFTGFEAQPSVRASWEVRPDRFVWGAVSRAIRTPTRFDSDIRFGPPGFQFIGNPNFKSEEVVAFEFGYRSRPMRQLSLDLAAFINEYDKLRSLEFQPRAGGILLLNNLNARTYGGEIAGAYDALENVRFTVGYSYLGRILTVVPGHTDVFNGTIEGNDPKHQFFIRGSADLPHRIEWDSTLRFISKLPSPEVPSYFELDGRLGWSPTGKVELSIIGRNLLHAQHPEFGPPSPAREEVERNIYGRIAFRFR